MKQLPVDQFSFTEIGGVGEMIYRAVRFPDYVPEHDYSEKEDVIKPVFTGIHTPTSGTDYSITGQELLASLCNLYKQINAQDYSEGITDMVWSWCRENIHPYDIDDLCDTIDSGDFMDAVFLERLQRQATFRVKDFVSDLCKLGTAFEYYDALTKAQYGDAQTGRSLYYEGRICDSLPFLEKYRQYTNDSDYVKHVTDDMDARVFDLLEMFPDFKMRVRQDRKTHKIEMGADIHSVFDIAWYSFARMVSDVAPPADTDPNYMFSQGTILTCMACGRYFVRHSSRQRYCDNPNCQAERNNRKARAYYKRKKAAEGQ
jgi:hypothetical protein